MCGELEGCEFSKTKHHLCVICGSILKTKCKKKACVSRGNTTTIMTSIELTSVSNISSSMVDVLISKMPLTAILASGEIQPNKDTNQEAAIATSNSMLLSMQSAISNLMVVLFNQINRISRGEIGLYNIEQSKFNRTFLALQRQYNCNCACHAIHALFGVLVDNSVDFGLWLKGCCCAVSTLSFNNLTDVYYCENRSDNCDNDGLGPVRTSALIILDPLNDVDLARALNHFKDTFTNDRSNPTNGVVTELMYLLCLTMNQRGGASNGGSGIFLGVRPLPPLKCTNFAGMLQALEPGNAAIIFYVGLHSSMGHFVTLWVDLTEKGNKIYFLHDAIVGLIGSESVAEMNAKINADSHYRKILSGSRYLRTLFLFSLPQSIYARKEAVVGACLNINAAGNRFLKDFLHLECNKEVSLPHNFMPSVLTASQIL